jgi:hypothetical protein
VVLTRTGNADALHRATVEQVAGLRKYRTFGDALTNASNKMLRRPQKMIIDVATGLELEACAREPFLLIGAESTQQWAFPTQIRKSGPNVSSVSADVLNMRGLLTSSPRPRFPSDVTRNGEGDTRGPGAH